MLKQRVLTALVLAPLVLGAIFYLPNPVFTALVAIVILFAARELALLAGATSHRGQALVMALCAALIAALWLLPQWHLPVLLSACAIWLLSLPWLLTPLTGSRRHGRWRGVKITLALTMTVPAWLALSRLHSWHPLWLIALFFLVWGADVGAYAAGKTLGRHKLAPKISPGKTWEGVIGGTFIAAGLMLLAAWLTGRIEGQWLIITVISLFIALISVAGDLMVSLLKRHAGSKDTGHLLPGHGGLMDRIDSLCAAAPFFATAAEWWRYSLEPVLAGGHFP